MTNGELIKKLQERDPAGDVQIFSVEDGLNVCCDIARVTGFINLPDTVIEVGEVRCTG